MYDEAILILHKYLEIDPEDVEVSDNLEALTIQKIK
jgi:septum formation topological specificity factor MinE